MRSARSHEMPAREPTDCTDRSIGSSGSPKRAPRVFSSLAMAPTISALALRGSTPFLRLNAPQTSVEIVNPGGTGIPRSVISARFAPLPPSRSPIWARPSALPAPKKYTLRRAFFSFGDRAVLEPAVFRRTAARFLAAAFLAADFLAADFAAPFFAPVFRAGRFFLALTYRIPDDLSEREPSHRSQRDPAPSSRARVPSPCRPLPNRSRK